VPQNLLELLMTSFDAAWPPPQGSGRVWRSGTVILDGNYDFWVCVSTGDPGVWKKLSDGASAFAAEDLTAQIDGNTDTFTTGFARYPGTIRVYLNGLDQGTPGTIASGAHVEELDTTTFQLDVVPPLGCELHVTYFA